MQRLKSGLECFSKGLEEGRSIFSLQKEWTDVVDQLVASLFEKTSNGREIAVLALGGYGRKEMSPYSDVDMMFLYDCSIDDVKPVVDSVVYPLWNEKLEAGGATRTLEDCRAMFYGDIRAQTAMLDSRYIAGSKKLAERFFKLLSSVQKKRFWRWRFVREKIKEQENRFKKFGDTVYMLEPHIKEGEGGLRELQTATWLSRVNNFSPPDPSLAEFLLDIRARLHLISGKREDRLNFENQNKISAALGVTAEQFMSEYYRTAASIHFASSKVFTASSPWWKRLNSHLEETKLNKLVGHRPTWQRLVANIDIIDEALLMMHRSGELIELIPNFRDIYFKAQAGAYHIYTVDQHSIYSVKAAVQLSVNGPENLRKVYKALKRKDILLLAALLHDIGKIDDKKVGHASLGAKIALQIAKDLGYSEEDAERVSFLVGSHLLMPGIAFSRDISDPSLVEKFASSIGSIETLDMLYILTYADIASIGPETWTSWKDRLLNELYKRTRNFLKGISTESIHKSVLRIKNKILEFDQTEASSSFLSNMPDKYFITTEEGKIKEHILMYSVVESSPVLTEHKALVSHSEFTVMTKDAPGIFSKIAGVMAANRVNILEAELNTAKNGTVLDILRVQGATGGALSPVAAGRISKDLEDVFSGKKEIDTLMRARSSVLKKKANNVAPKVEIDNDVSVYYTVIDVIAGDRVGLLYDITRILFEHGLDIDVAKVLTKADAVQDSFYVKDANKGKITSRDLLNVIKEAVTGVL